MGGDRGAGIGAGEGGGSLASVAVDVEDSDSVSQDAAVALVDDVSADDDGAEESEDMSGL